MKSINIDYRTSQLMFIPSFSNLIFVDVIFQVERLKECQSKTCNVNTNIRQSFLKSCLTSLELNKIESSKKSKKILASIVLSLIDYGTNVA